MFARWNNDIVGAAAAVAWALIVGVIGASAKLSRPRRFAPGSLR